MNEIKEIKKLLKKWEKTKIKRKYDPLSEERAICQIINDLNDLIKKLS